MAVFKAGVFGAGQRLSTSAFVVLGLLTFWVYSVWRFAVVLRGHLDRRWVETVSRPDLKDAEPGQLAALRARGYSAARLVPFGAMACFLASALLVAGWFYKWIVMADTDDYRVVVGVVAVSSALFYAGTLLLLLWALAIVRRHETTELLVREMGAGALSGQVELGDEMVGRWERQTNTVVLFLVAALPIVFSPTFGAHLYLTGTVWGQELVLPAICFVLAAVFHLWGTVVLVGLYNGHLGEEARMAGSALLTSQAPAAIEQAGDAGPQRELVAIMMTDMQGYSKAMERNEARAYAKLVEHNQIMRGAIEKHRGREIKTIGDAFLVIFRSALDAVDCAVAAQRGFADYNSGKAEDERIMVRIGIHLGDVLMTGNDVYGDGVNVAARIEPLAVPGGICVSEPVFEMVRKKVQLDVQEVEGASLKNISIAPRLYRIRLRAA